MNQDKRRYFLLAVLMLFMASCSHQGERIDVCCDADTKKTKELDIYLNGKHFVPQVKDFIDYYHADKNLAAQQTLPEYLIWVDRYYNGWLMVPQGWIKTTKRILKRSPETDHQTIVQKMSRTGFEIAREWSKHKEVSQIKIENLMVWAQGLSTSATNQETPKYLDAVMSDIELVMSQQLQASDIVYERYFPSNQDESTSDEQDPEFGFD